MPRPVLSHKRSTVIIVLLLAAGNFGFIRYAAVKRKHLPAHHLALSLYDQLLLSAKGLKRDIFEKALAGWERLKNGQQLGRTGLLSIADLSQSSNSKRLYVIDMDNKVVLFHTYVSHGRNSGEEFAYSFGNEMQSYKSSLGFYLTGSTYNGAHGLSMKLRGLEEGINHRAEQRGIVMHGAAYVSESFIRRNGRLGRSQGCPAVPEKICKPIINSIKEGSCFYVFYPDSNYFRSSAFYN